MEGLANDFTNQWAATQRPMCGRALTPGFTVNGLAWNLDLSPFDDDDAQRLALSNVQVCLALPHTLNDPENSKSLTVPCSECSYGWENAGKEGPLMCKPGNVCKDQPKGECQICEMSPTQFFVKGPCEACIGEPVCLNGRCSCW